MIHELYKKWGKNGDCEHCIADGMPICANECPKGAIFFANKALSIELVL